MPPPTKQRHCVLNRTRLFCWCQMARGTKSDRGKTPSFSGLRPSSPASARSKRANRARDTSQELALRRAVWRLGLRYLKNVNWLPGKPDIVFTRARVAVFCDGDFWHGRRWPVLGRKLATGANASYWAAKIRFNIARDASVSERLRQDGWRVVRLWETDILRDPVAIARRVSTTVRRRLRAGSAVR